MDGQAYLCWTKLDEQNYILGNTLTGVFKIISRSELDEITACLDNAKEDPNLINLYSCGILQPPDFNYEVFYKKLARLFEVESKYVESNKGFGIIPTYNCNFRCPYCFEAQLRKRGVDWFRKLMNFDLVDKIFTEIDRYESIRTGLPQPIHIFGGEPLLIENRPLIEYILDKGRKRDQTFSITTNGSTLIEYSSLLSQQKISYIQVTLDGPPDIHNKQRFSYLGDQSFQRIIQGIHTLRESNLQLVLTVKMNAETAQSLGRLAEILIAENMHKDPGIKITIGGLYGKKSCTQAISFAQHHLNKIILQANAYYDEEIFKICLIKEDFFRNAINGLPTKPSFWYCGANTQTLIFDPFGDVYSCWFMVGDLRNKVGKLGESIEWDEQNRLKWKERHIFSLEKCRSCKYALICGGGCGYEAFLENGSLNEVVCPDFDDAIKNWLPIFYKTCFLPK
jgi:uncharacterized protein